MFLGIVIIVALTVAAFIVLIGSEQRDKRIREEKGPPAKKYHDITDSDVTTVYSIRHK